MKIEQILSLYAQHQGVEDFLRAMGGEQTPLRIHCEGLRASSVAVVMATAGQKVARPFLCVLRDEEEAGYFYNDLVQLLGNSNVLFYPSAFRRAAKYAQRDAANEILRTAALERLSSFEQDRQTLFVVTHPAALGERITSKANLSEQTLRLSQGDTHDLVALERQLRELGFTPCDYVYEPGEYALRGSILDIFSYSSELPFRLDFFGDEIDSIRTFEIESQLSKERCERISIVPPVPINGERVSLGHFLPKTTLVVTPDLPYIIDSVEQIYDTGFTLAAQAEQEAEGTMPLDKEAWLVDGKTILQDLSPLAIVTFGNRPPEMAHRLIQFHTVAQPTLHKKFELARGSFIDLQDEGYKIFILADSEKQTERLRHIFDELDAQPKAVAKVEFTPVKKTLHEGFRDEDLKICLFTDHQIFDRFHKYSLRSETARNAKMALTLKELQQFSVGDFVVHIDHGVGRFAGLVRVPTDSGEMQEMIKLTYDRGDVVLVPIHALHKVSKYKGREGTAPTLSRLGTGAWERIKEKTKKKIKDIARDLILLYSERQREKGFAFSADTYMQHELEANFAYEDTPDQLKVTQEVKADMESPRPMDRLVCGDVGFGKTEIAVRAAMKAAADSKQVAVLVPTTVLAFQHYKTFSSRLKDFPVRVDYLTRARTPKQSKELLKDLAEGKIDILVGTHKLIGKSVRFHDLGLLIIDEEQKFGVAVKERLRQLKVNVDTLTLSATPIPRTLQFSLMGARDFSTIQTPPPNRHPIRTEVHTFGHEILAEAVNFEMSRNGQVYIVTHRIAQLETLRRMLQQHVPDARIVTGHGQMPPDELEKVILDFVNYDYDVLISTTIIENGIDIPNANTIIIDGAHHFGLSDLHQMRGRVGRGGRKAFCYLLAPPLSLLPNESRRRLQAIEQFSDLGSGIHIAMQDLDIRGAGNMLGAEQSGFIADLGYETYQKILAQAVSELKIDEFGDLFKDKLEEERTAEFFVDDCLVDGDIKAFFPETYVPGGSERMLLYRELDSLTTDDAVERFRQRMTDRFGPLPEEGEELLRIVPLRQLGRKLGCERLQLKRHRLTLTFIQNANHAFFKSPVFDKVIQYAMTHYHTCELSDQNGRRRMTIKDVTTISQALDTLQQVLGNAI